MNWKINRYNKKTAKQFGWHPSWFSSRLRSFDDNLIYEVMKFQRRCNLEEDGMVGPTTYRRILTEREASEIEMKNFISINNQRIPIDWDVKIDLIKPGSYKDVEKFRNVKMIVTHWDATTSAKTCKRILEARNISTHFCIDNDGVIYQFLDTNNVAWHAGRRTINNRSIGVDFSNAYYLKYNEKYKKMGFNKRPIINDSTVHGVKLKSHLGYYNVQIKAYKTLLKVLCTYYNIPLQVPEDENGELLTRVHEESVKSKFNGIVCHYHLTRNKIDCAGLKLKNIIDSLH